MEKPLNIPSQHKVVSDWARITSERLGENILKRRIGKSGDLSRSLTYKVIGALNSPEKVILSHLYYGKFVDMGVGKGQRVGDIKGNKEILTAAGIKGRRPKKWYSKTIYAETNKLADFLQQNFSIKASAVIKENIPSQINLEL